MNGSVVPEYLLLSTSLLVDRILQHTSLLETLRKSGSVSVWATSFAGKDTDVFEKSDAKYSSFPAVRPYREHPHNYLRRLNEFVWDYRYQPPSRMSVMEHFKNRKLRRHVRILKYPAKLLALGRTEETLEKALEKLLISYPRSIESVQRLISQRPDVVVSTGPFQFEQPAVHAAARQLGIPTLAYIPSWDNVSTKNRMVFKYDGYIVWNEHSKDELHEFYPQSRNSPVYVVGAPQFDVFYQPRFASSREEFCKIQGLDPTLPIIVYAIGSPNFLKEYHGAVYLAERVSAGHLGNVQMLVRPHPIHDNAEMRHLFEEFQPLVRLQQTPNAGKTPTNKSQDELQVKEWVSTFRHADVVVNLSSTVTIDAAICDKPVVNLDFDPQPGQTDQQLVKDVNHKWSHFKPIAESGGVWLVNDFQELEEAVKTYLSTPSLHSEKRKWIAEYVCGFLDGKCGERMSTAIVDFVNTTTLNGKESQ